METRRARLTPVVASHDGWPWPETLVATEVSPRGLYLTLDRGIFPEGHGVRLSFRLGTADVWELDGIVTHGSLRRRATDLGYTGMGVELVGSSPLERMRMRQLLRGVPPPLPPRARRPSTDQGEGRRRRNRPGGRRASDPQRSSARWGRPSAIIARTAGLLY